MLEYTCEVSNGMLAFMGLGHWEIAAIVLAILLLFGGKKIPELARGLGRGLRLFKQEVKGMKKEIDIDSEDGTDEESENKD